MGILIALFILLFLLLLLSMPILVRVRARLGVRGAVVHARLYLLGLIPVPVIVLQQEDSRHGIDTANGHVLLHRRVQH